MSEIQTPVEKVAAEYAPKINTYLQTIGEALRASGLDVDGPYDMTADDYRWSLIVRPDANSPDDDIIDVTVEIAEASTYGDDDAPNGINFGLTVVEYGGRILGGKTPFNYTDEVWVNAADADAVAQRWALFDAAEDGSAIAGMISKSR
jgi:hypothetical protein